MCIETCDLFADKCVLLGSRHLANINEIPDILTACVFRGSEDEGNIGEGRAGTGKVWTGIHWHPGSSN